VGEAEGLLVVGVRVEAIFGTVDGFTVEAAVGTRLVGVMEDGSG